MPLLSRVRPLLAASLLTLTLQGCASQPTATDVPVSAKVIAEQIGHIQPSRRDTCGTQQQIAAQSSRIDSMIKGGPETVYKPAPCIEPASKKMS